MERHLIKDYIVMKTVMSILEIFRMENLMVMVFIHIRMEINMKVIYLIYFIILYLK